MFRKKELKKPISFTHVKLKIFRDAIEDFTPFTQDRHNIRTYLQNFFAALNAESHKNPPWLQLSATQELKQFVDLLMEMNQRKSVAKSADLITQEDRTLACSAQSLRSNDAMLNEVLSGMEELKQINLDLGEPDCQSFPHSQAQFNGEEILKQLHDQSFQNATFPFNRAGQNAVGDASDTLVAGASSTKFKSVTYKPNNAIQTKAIETELRVRDSTFENRSLSVKYFLNGLKQAQSDLQAYYDECEQAMNFVASKIMIDETFLKEKKELEKLIESSHQSIITKRDKILLDKMDVDEILELKRTVYNEKVYSTAKIYRAEERLTTLAEKMGDPLVQHEIEKLKIKWADELKFLCDTLQFSSSVVKALGNKVSPDESQCIALQKQLSEAIKAEKNQDKITEMSEQLHFIETLLSEFAAVKKHNQACRQAKKASHLINVDKPNSSICNDVEVQDYDELVIHRSADDQLNPLIATLVFLIDNTTKQQLPKELLSLIICYLPLMQYSQFYAVDSSSTTFSMTSETGLVLPAFINPAARKSFFDNFSYDKLNTIQTNFVMRNGTHYGFVFMNKTEHEFTATPTIKGFKTGCYLVNPYDLAIIDTTASHAEGEFTPNSHLKITYKKTDAESDTKSEDEVKENKNKVSVEFTSVTSNQKFYYSPMAYKDKIFTPSLHPIQDAATIHFSFPSLSRNFQFFNKKLLSPSACKQTRLLTTLLFQALIKHPNSAELALLHLERSNWSKEVEHWKRLINPSTLDKVSEAFRRLF